MAEDISQIVVTADDHMKKAITHLETELIKIRAGKATPQILDGIVVDYYGSPTPINQVGNINVMDARTLSIQPWEKNMLQPIERAIIAANIQNITDKFITTVDKHLISKEKEIMSV